MAEKLSESSWTGFAKKQKADLEDGDLVKALAKFDKTDESKLDGRLAALEAVVEQFTKQIAATAKRKKDLGDKPFGEIKDKLYAMLEVAEKQLKDVRAAQAAAAAGDEEEEDSPALLTGKMIPLLRDLRKGQVQMHALVTTAGKNSAVLIMRKPIAPPRRKLLQEFVDAKGGAKHVPGTCLFEDNALTFVVQAPSAGLAKRIREALLRQTDLRFKVRVRGEDGATDEDGEEDVPAQAAPGAIPPAPPQPAKVAFETRQAALRERVAEALKAQHPESSKLRAVLGFASEKGEGAGDYPAAMKALDMVEQLLKSTAGAAAPAAASAGTNVDAGAAFTARLAALLPAIKAAAAQGLSGADDIRLKASEAGVFARNRDFARAGALLDEVEQMLSAATTADAEDAEDQDEEDAGRDPGAIRDRLNELGLRLRELAGQPDFESLRERFTAAAAALRNKDWAETESLLDDIEPDIVDALSAARAEAARPDGVSLRKMAQASLAWRRACEDARQQVAALKSEVLLRLAAEGELDAEEIDEVAVRLDGMNGLLEKLDMKLSDMVDRAIDEPAERRKPVLQQLMQLTDRAESAISGDPMFAVVSDNGLLKIDLAGPALTALAALRGAFAPALAG